MASITTVDLSSYEGTKKLRLGEEWGEVSSFSGKLWGKFREVTIIYSCCINSCFISHHSLIGSLFFFSGHLFFPGGERKKHFCVFFGMIVSREWWNFTSTCWLMVENNKLIQVSIDLVFFSSWSSICIGRILCSIGGPPPNSEIRAFFLRDLQRKTCHVILVMTVTIWGVYLGSTLHPVTVTTRIIPLLVGNP